MSVMSIIVVIKSSSRDPSYYLSRWATKVAPATKRNESQHHLLHDDKNLFHNPSLAFGNKNYLSSQKNSFNNEKDYDFYMLNQFHTIIAPTQKDSTTPRPQFGYTADNFRRPPPLPSAITKRPISNQDNQRSNKTFSLFNANLNPTIPALSSGLESSASSASFLQQDIPSLSASLRAPAFSFDVSPDTLSVPQQVKEFPAESTTALSSSEFHHTTEDDRDPRCE